MLKGKDSIDVFLNHQTVIESLEQGWCEVGGFSLDGWRQEIDLGRACLHCGPR